LRRVAVLSLAAVLLAGTAVAISWTASDSTPAVSYAADVQPIFDRDCISCHPSAYPYLDLRAGRSWSQLVRVTAATDLAFERVLPGRPELSYLITHNPDPSNAMLLTPGDRDLIARWIRAGAPDN
jgi:hypothetical protein